ncbi:ABA4-like family protein [Streptomyces sp. NBC_01142]|uniref:ABA4-like family protein n=1 Tax=Streptomyces sp. NBC_01142 TaxID=2975865 RepID=UPI0022535FFE|nr:ABA4-like family protein [Streptomyces sp. NBC_01142]MCX4823975.1 ABA4-like family protein [Streptomyces sp. NBC_01142]
MTGFLFELAFWLAAPIWLLLILAPHARVTARIAATPLTVIPVLVVYFAMAIPVFPELWAAVRSPDIDGFRDLAILANGAGAVWAQIIAWDLLLGQWMFLEARRLGIHPLVMGPLLVATILLSPFALPVFLVVRAVKTRSVAERPEPGTGSSASLEGTSRA